MRSPIERTRDTPGRSKPLKSELGHGVMDIDFLRGHALFGGLSAAQMEEVVPLLQKEEYAAGETILREGEEGDRLFFICRGAVAVLKDCDTKNGTQRQQLAILKEGDAFGEMEVIDIQRRSATVRAKQDVELLSLSHANLYRLYEVDLPAFTMIIMNMAREISRRLRKMDSLVAEMRAAQDPPSE